MEQFNLIDVYMKRFLLAVVVLFITFPVFSISVIHQGDSRNGDALVCFDGKNVRVGDTPYGKVLYNWDGKYIRQGDSRFGTVLYNWDGQKLRQGETPYGTVIFNVDGDFPIAVIIVLVI